MFSIGKKKKDNQAVVGEIKNKPAVLTDKRRLVGLLVFIFVLLAGIAGGYYLWQNNKAEQEAKKDCSQKTTQACTILEESIPLFDSKKLPELDAKVKQIKTIEDYEQNPNLLYVVTTYYINISDGTNARMYLDLLKASYKDDIGYDPVLLTNSKIHISKPQELENFVKFLEEQSKKSNQILKGVKDQQ